MEIIYRPFDKGGLFSKFDTDYTTDSQIFKAFYQYEPNLKGLLESIEQRKKHPTNRALLVETLQEQYQHLDAGADILETIQSLNHQNVFTVTTAHQPCLFTGPLYVIYKAISTIKLADILNRESPSTKVIPVMVIGGEDHDKEEINHLHLFGKKLVWDTPQNGPCGRFSLEGIDQVIEELKEILGTGDHAIQILDIIKQSFIPSRNYVTALQSMMHLLLGGKGLVILNMDQSGLKSTFSEIMLDELLNQTSGKLIGATQKAIESKGYKPATFLRPVNLFYFHKGLRERIDYEKDQFTIHETDLTFTPEEIESELRKFPEKFSPNVNMRPLYQELILPNLAYVGGGGELAYWMERKSHFEHYQIPFPALIRRDSILWVDKTTTKKLEKLELPIDAFLEHDVDKIIFDFVGEHSKNELDIEAEKSAMEDLIDKIIEKGHHVDNTLKPAFEAEKVRLMKTIDQLGGRIVRAEKHKQEVSINQIRHIKEKLFPSGNLQERHDNFMSLYVRYGDELFDILLDHLDPLRKELKIILEAG